MVGDPNPDNENRIDGMQVAQAFVLARTNGAGTYASSIQSCDEEWTLIEQSLRGLPIEERIRFLGSICDRLNEERLQESIDDGNLADSKSGSIPIENNSHLSNIEAQWVLVRGMSIYQVLDACGEVPNYTFRQLMVHLRSMKVDAARRFAQAIAGYFPHYAEERWIDIYGSPEAVAASKFRQWTSFEWSQLEDWIEKVEQNYTALLEAEIKDEENEGVADQKARRRPRIASTDTDAVRVLEAMRRSGIIDPKTTGPQIVAAFEWIGKLNEKPGNYDSTKAQADHTPPSDAIVRLIQELLQTAGPDVKEEVIRICKRL